MTVTLNESSAFLGLHFLVLEALAWFKEEVRVLNERSCQAVFISWELQYHVIAFTEGESGQHREMLVLLNILSLDFLQVGIIRLIF